MTLRYNGQGKDIADIDLVDGELVVKCLPSLRLRIG
jgi:hypothetical protein